MTGDKEDIYNRLIAVSPGWFGDYHAVLDAVLSSAATSLAWCYGLIEYARLQTRIKTATDSFLDTIALDFFGDKVKRKGLNDASFRAKIITNLFRERGTRSSVSSVLSDLTGNEPTIFEPMNSIDTGYYGAMAGYGVAGRYGSKLLPYQCFLIIRRKLGTGAPFVAGYGSPSGGYSTPSRACYFDINLIETSVTDDDIYGAIDSVKPAGTTVWTKITN